MKDIATALGVSVVTVSKVLNGNPSISAETTKRVLDCARELGYRPNLAAKGLATGQSKIVGLIVPELMHGFFAEVAASLLNSLRSEGYGLIISSSRDNAEMEREELRQMASRHVDGLVIASCESNSPVLRDLAAEIPTVLLDRRVKNLPGTAFVGTDDVNVGELATRHLIQAGYKKIAYMAGSRLAPSVDRELGYRRALKAARLPFEASRVLRLPQNEESTHRLAAEAIDGLLKGRSLPDAIFCYQDSMAYGAIHSLLKSGLSIPTDFGVVGCGNLRLNEFMQVPLTTVDQNTFQLGAESARMVVRMIEARRTHSKIHSKETLVPARLVQGKSTRSSHQKDAPQLRRSAAHRSTKK